MAAPLSSGDFMSPYEAEHMIRSLKPIDIREVGSKL